MSASPIVTTLFVLLLSSWLLLIVWFVRLLLVVFLSPIQHRTLLILTHRQARVQAATLHAGLVV